MPDSAVNVFLDERWGIFMRVAELGSFTRAAHVLEVPQSNISRHMAQLESELKVRLFDRNGRGVTLSEIGRRLLPTLNELARRAEDLTDEIRTEGQQPIGEVRVGLLPSMPSAMIEELFRSARDQFPLVQLHFCEGASSQLKEFVDEGRIDMATLADEDETVPDPGATLTRIPLKLVGPKDAPLIQKPTVRFRELENVPLVVPSVSHPFRARLAKLEKSHQIKLVYAVEADSIKLQHAIAAAGGGYAITAGLPGQAESMGLAASTIVEPELMRNVVLVTTLRRPSTLATRKIEALVRARGQQLFKERPIS